MNKTYILCSILIGIFLIFCASVSFRGFSLVAIPAILFIGLVYFVGFASYKLSKDRSNNPVDTNINKIIYLIVSVVFVPSWLYIFLKYGSIHEWNGAYTNLLGQYVSGEEWTGPAQFIFWISTIFIGFPYVSYTMKFFRKKFDIRKLL